MSSTPSTCSRLKTSTWRRRDELLTDQDVYAATVTLLRASGHDVVTAAELGLSRADDSDLLRVAQEQGRIFGTRDRDFGGLVFVAGKGPGVIFLRILPSTQQAVHTELARVQSLHAEQELQASFVVVEPGRHRVRRLGTSPQPTDESSVNGSTGQPEGN